MQTQEGFQLELALDEALRRKQCEQWLTENSEAVKCLQRRRGSPRRFQRRRTELLKPISRYMAVFRPATTGIR